MKKIEKLTSEQEAQMAVYRDKWIKIGLSTEDFTFDTAKKIADFYYEEIANKPKVPVVIMDSPYTAWIAVCLLAVWDQVESQVRNQVRNQVESFIFPYLGGHIDSGYLSFYNFMKEILNIKLGKKWDWYENTSKVGLIYPLENVCVISRKPIEINIKDGRLHAEGKPAIKYADGFSVWALNGVRVPQYLAETPASNLDIEFFKKEQNADIKAEFIRKYGIERMVEMGKLIDTWQNHEGTLNFEWYKKSEYKLIDMSPIFTTYIYLPYLYMKNQTVPGIYHLECCFNPNSIKQPKTILEGLKVRLNGVDPESLEITSIA